MKILGNKTETIFLKGIESHKLHHEFEIAADATIMVGQPVKLNADGEVLPAGDEEPLANIIGYSVHSGVAGELVTIGMRAFTIVWAMPNLALDAGPVAYDGMNDEDGKYNSFKAATSTTEGAVTITPGIIGWALDASEGPDELIRVALH